MRDCPTYRTPVGVECGQKRKRKAVPDVKDRLYTLMVSAVMIGGTLLIGWGVLVVIDRLMGALGI